MKTKISDILKSYDTIMFALLFGSYSTNTQNFLSDVDIAIYTKEDIDLFTQGEMIAVLESELGKRVDLIVINDLYKTNTKLSFNITNNHEVLFCNDEEKYVDFKANSLKYYFDISYMYNMFDSGLKKRISDGTYGKIKAS